MLYVRAVLRLLDAPEVEGEVVNIGQGAEISINELAERVRSLTNSTSEIVRVPYEEVYGPEFEDMKRRTPDISKLRAATGYEPQHAIDDILRDVIAFMEDSGDVAPTQGEPDATPASVAS